MGTNARLNNSSSFSHSHNAFLHLILALSFVVVQVGHDVGAWTQSTAEDGDETQDLHSRRQGRLRGRGHGVGTDRLNGQRLRAPQQNTLGDVRQHVGGWLIYLFE